MSTENKKNDANQLFFYLVTSAFLLTAFGLLYVYAASALKGAQIYHNPYFFFQKQLITACLGFFVIFLVRLVPLSWLSMLTVPLCLLTLFCLVLVFVPGAYLRVGGALRWLDLKVIRFQPSELAKIALVFFLAKNLSRTSANINHFTKGILPNLLVFGLFAICLLRQPDFGSTVLLALVTFLMLFVAGASRRFLLTSTGLAFLAVSLGIATASYRMRRLLSFLDPWSHMNSGGFQIIQSFLAFRNGHFLGVGFGESKQKLFFLPEAHTDFIFAVIAEEAGLLGTSTIVALFACLVYAGFKIAILQNNLFYRLLCFGLTSLIAIQALFNLGVVTSLLPTKGIPLPLVSSGSSSLLIFLFAIAILGKFATETKYLR